MHIDLNSTKPTLQGIEWAFPYWSTKGICLLDDYLDKSCAEQHHHVEVFFADKDLEIIGLPTGQGFVIRKWTGKAN